MAVDPAIAPAPQHRFTKMEGKNVLVVDLPMLQSLADVELNIGQAEIQLCLPGGSTTLIPLLPELFSNVETDAAVAKFSRKRGQLTISWTLPVDVAQAEGCSVEPHDESVECSESFDRQRHVASAEIETVNTDSSNSLADQSTVDVADEAGRADTGQELAHAPVQKAAPAHGSLWNANSWHWEEKNCIELLRSEVQHALGQCMAERLKHVNDLSGASVLLSDINVDGEASFALRRGKRILCYEISVSFKWEVRDAYGGALGAKGKGSVAELTQEDEVPQVSIEVSTTFSGGKEAKAAGEWMRRKGASEIGKFLLGPRICSSMLASEESRTNVDEDVARRAAERKMAEDAQKATADRRAELAAKQKELEEARRCAPAEGVVQGSVWNANAWHWEEKPMTAWAHAWLQRRLEGMVVSMLGNLASVIFSEPKVSGDASVSIRKGKPITLFQIRIECKWATRESTQGVGEAQGTLVVPEFTSEDGAKSTIDVLAGGNAKKVAGQLLLGVRREGVPAVRAVLSQFVEELKGQTDRSAS
jgi:activator of HSP90 ATPase